jgi:hypothetical protein
VDIPSFHEINQWLDAGTVVSYAKVNCTVCDAEYPVAEAASHSCSPYLKAAIDELRTTVRELERKHAAMEDRLSGDGK